MEEYDVITVYRNDAPLFVLHDTVFTGGMLSLFPHNNEQEVMILVTFDDITICEK